MTRLIATFVTLLFAGGLGACEKKEEPKPTATTSATGTASPTGAAGEAETIDDEDVPTEEDFEAEAAQQITSDNLEDELDKLEEEIKAE